MDSQRRHRVRVSEGIYRDRWGLSAKVQAGGQTREKRYRANTSIKTMQRWRAETRIALRAAADRATRGTLAADVERYLQTVAHLASYRDRKHDIALWVTEFGHRRRDTITTAEIDAVLSRWLAEGLAASTVRHRRTALYSLWVALDGAEARNPVRAALLPRQPAPEARALSYVTIERILKAMPDIGVAPKGQARPEVSLTKARLRVLAYTGLPQASIMRLRPEDIDLEHARLTIRPRRKGAGTTTRVVPLTPHGVEALRQFIAVGAWGPFSTSAMRYSFLRACKAAGVTGARPYDLRHSFGTAIYLASGDILAASKFLAHSSTTTTQRYTLAAEDARLRQVAEDVAGTFPKIRVAVRRGSTPATRKRPA